MEDKEKKKGFFGKLFDKLDKKLEEKAQNRPCCSGGGEKDKGKDDKPCCS